MAWVCCSYQLCWLGLNKGQQLCQQAAGFCVDFGLTQRCLEGRNVIRTAPALTSEIATLCPKAGGVLNVHGLHSKSAVLAADLRRPLPFYQ